MSKKLATGTMTETTFVKPLSLAESKKKNYINIVKTHFNKKFGSDPSFYVRAPGRVNLIGEHIDYCGYAVFPMAIEQDILVAISLNGSNKINLTNVKESLYPDFTTSLDVLKIDSLNPKWYHYYLCGFLGMVEHASYDYLSSSSGLDIAVLGTVPPSAGLSSSSALVCAAALATMHAYSLSVSKLELASLSSKCERYIGTEGGGMDHAISVLAEPGSAKLIEFNPLQTTNVLLPEGAIFVIANSCVEINKAATSHYNIRVVECRLATQILAKACGLNVTEVSKLKDVQEFANIPVDQMEKKVKEVLHENPYSRTEVCQILELSDSEFETTLLSANTKFLQEFKLYQRALHVYQEASRVWRFKEICEKKSETSLLMLGQLMTESHASCRDLYECSHPDLDELVQLCLKAGALGSRLTGAGWGGCTVSLVPFEKVDNFLVDLKKNYYSKHFRLQELLDTAIFPTKPGGGAVIYED
ncbi:N-acetylgalactosamine kinase-like isoform X2 [Limulus polyphemus]|uniref:N-acetylgalactosamine kinase-like isoform X2 n=1 Tax=Limulus polyphemus TaxID=6850 RepID=A0ABM1SV81_LIMPO|nr:N-acetylgalactosamine kinase-like isoform X2 [Limulus polyphemus]